MMDHRALRRHSDEDRYAREDRYMRRILGFLVFMWLAIIGAGAWALFELVNWVTTK